MIKPRESHWREVAEQYTLTPEVFSIGLADEIARILSENGCEPPSSLLEAGCGSGHLSLELARRGYQADVLDFEPLAVEKARASYKKAFGRRANKYQYLLGDLNKLPKALGSRKYDVVWNSGVLEHFSAELLAHVFKQMGMVARKAVFCIVPNSQSLVYLAYRQKMLEEGRWSFGVEFLREDYLKIAKKSGLEPLHSGFCGVGYTRNFLEFVVPSDASKHFATLFDGNMVPSELVLAYYIFLPQSQRKMASRKATDRKSSAGRQVALMVETDSMLDKTFYLDAMGAANATITNLKQQLDSARAVAQESHTILAQREGEMEKLRDKLAQHLAHATDLDRQLSESSARTKQQEVALMERHNLLLSLEARVLDKDQVVQNLSDRLQRELGLAGQADEEALERENRLNELRSKNLRLQDELDQHQKAWSEREARTAVESARADTAQRELAVSKGQLKDLRDLLADREQTMHALQRQLEEAIAETLQAKTALQERQIQIGELRSQLEKREEEFSIRENALVELREKLEVLQHQHEQQLAVLQHEHEQQLAVLQHEHEQQLENGRGLQRRFEEQKELATRLEFERMAIKERFQSAQVETERLKAAFSEKNRDLENHIKELQLKLSEADHRIGTLHQTEQALRIEQDGLNTRLIDLEAIQRQFEEREKTNETERSRLTTKLDLERQEFEQRARDDQAELAKLRQKLTMEEQSNEQLAKNSQALAELQESMRSTQSEFRNKIKELRAIAAGLQVELIREQHTSQTALRQSRDQALAFDKLQESLLLVQQEINKRIEAAEGCQRELQTQLVDKDVQFADLQKQYQLQSQAWHELTLTSLMAIEELKHNLHLKRRDALEAADTLRQYQGLKRYRWAHRLHLLSQHIGRGSIRKRITFLKTLTGKSGHAEVEPDTLNVPLHTIGKISEYLVMADQLCESLKTGWSRLPSILTPEMQMAERSQDNGHKIVPFSPEASLSLDNFFTPFQKRMPPLPRAPHGRRRVAYLTNQLLDWNDQRPRYGGGERYALELARLLRELGLEVTFFQPAVRSCEGRYEDFLVKCFVPGETFSEFAYGTCSFFTEQSDEYDHVLHKLPEYSSGIIRQDALMICHGIWFDHNHYPGAKFRTQEWYAHLYRAFSNPRAIVSVDTNSINYIRAVWPDLAPHMRYIPNFYRAGDFKPDPRQRNPDRLKILFPRRSQINRGSRILEAILNRIPHDVDFCWVGEGDPEDTEIIRQLSQRDKRLTFHCADFDAMPRWYQRSDITVIPTLACEGTSLSCLEALASGSATISTNVGGLSDLLQDGNNGLLVDPFPEPLAEAINRLIENPEERKRLEKAGPESAKTFELQNWRRKWTRILLEQKWTTEDAVARLGFESHTETALPLWKNSGEVGAPRIGIITRNATHGGVETIVEFERRELNAEVVVTGGLDTPTTCPFPYTRADTYEELIKKLVGFDVLLYHWIHDLALQAIQDSGLPSIEFVHRTDTAESDKSVPTKIITHSDFLAEYIMETYGCPCEVVPHPIDLEHFKPARKTGNCIGAVTSFYSTKGIDILLRAWALIARKFPNLQVRFYGSGPEKQNLENLASELGITAQFLPPVRDPWRVFEEFACFALPSRLEGLPMTVLEAMAMDIPIVASDIPGVVEFNATVERLGFGTPLHTFKQENSEDLARVLTEILKRKKRPHTSAFIQKFHSPAQHARKLREILNQSFRHSGRKSRHLKMVQTWVDERMLATPDQAEGVYLLEVGENGEMRQVFCATVEEYRRYPITNSRFPIFLVCLPKGASQLEWETTADCEATIGWQIDWLAEDFSSLGFQAGGTTLIPDKQLGGLGREIPVESFYAKVAFRPRPNDICHLGPFLLRAFSNEDNTPAEEPLLETAGA